METLKLDWPLGDSSIAVATLNRPDALNAMNTRMIQELLDLFREQAYNEALRCIILTPDTQVLAIISHCPTYTKAVMNVL